MNASNLARQAITQRFSRAAEDYDGAASVQARIARHLAGKFFHMTREPQAILDIGCGTGFVAELAAQRWPGAQLTLMDGAPGMLEEARRKLPAARAIAGDIANQSFEPSFDFIFSSMALHWLPSPRAALEFWRKGLKPQGRLFAALLIEGSFREWSDLAAAGELADGLWPLPRAGFADGLAASIERQTLIVPYPSALDFLRCLKRTGAVTPRPGYRPFGPASMRRILLRAPRPFAVTYQVLYIEIQSSGSI